MEAISQILAAVPDWIEAIALVVAGASAVAALTPTTRDDEVLGKIKNVLNWLALNVGGAKPQKKE